MGFLIGKKWVGLVILVVTMSLIDASEGNKKEGYEVPMNCKQQLECAPYEIIHTQKEFEIRSYKNAMWASTSLVKSTSYKDATTKGFNVLFSYIQGNNDQATRINMTAPVIVDIYPSTGPFCNSSFVVNFYIPRKYQKKPPLSNQTHLVTLPKHKYAAVRRFTGFMDDTNIPTQALALKKSLKGTIWESSLVETMAHYSVAGYNSPFEYENRVNEVMFWFDKY